MWQLFCIDFSFHLFLKYIGKCIETICEPKAKYPWFQCQKESVILDSTAHNDKNNCRKRKRNCSTIFARDYDRQVI